ncbi:hypothetical protein KKH05_00135 [Patescibacteria group bacterium]|nr:hypothetical protein [Patescibacteria group bacterium]
MKKLTYILVGVFLLLGAVSVNAATFGGGEAYALSASDTVEGNLYTGGASVNVSGKVTGDLIAAGGNLSFTGFVAEDLIVAGGTINVLGDVGDDVRVAGGNITVAGKVGGELIGAGGQMVVLSSSAVKGDLVLNGGSVRVEAPVGGDVEINGGNVYLNGSVGGSLVIRAEKIELGPDANIRGDFNYYSKSEVILGEGAVVAGETIFHKQEAPLKNDVGAKGFGIILMGLGVFKILILSLVAVLFVNLFKKWTNNFVKDATKSFWKNVLFGFATLFLTPIAVILLMITVVGMIPAGVLMSTYIAGILVSCILTGILTAALLNKYLLKKPINDLEWWKILLGVAVFQLVKWIPFIGWLGCMLIMFASFGWLASVVAGVLSKGRR